MALADTYAPDYKKQYEAALQQVNNQYETQRNALREQQAALPYQYQQQRDQTYAQGQQSLNQADEWNAAHGLYRSGPARSDMTRIINNRDTGINALNQQQQQAQNAFGNRYAELGSQQAAAIAALQGQEGQAEREYNLQRELAYLPYQKMSAAQQADIGLRQQEMANQQQQAMLPYSQMTAAQQAQLALQQQQNALAQAELYGQSATGQKTLAGQNAANEYDLQRQQLANAMQIAQMPYNGMTAAQKAELNRQGATSLLDFILGKANVTGTLDQASNFNENDILLTALKAAFPQFFV